MFFYIFNFIKNIFSCINKCASVLIEDFFGIYHKYVPDCIKETNISKSALQEHSLFSLWTASCKIVDAALNNIHQQYSI